MVEYGSDFCLPSAQKACSKARLVRFELPGRAFLWGGAGFTARVAPWNVWGASGLIWHSAISRIRCIRTRSIRICARRRQPVCFLQTQVQPLVKRQIGKLFLSGLPTYALRLLGIRAPVECFRIMLVRMRQRRPEPVRPM